MASFDILHNLLKENRSLEDNQRIYEWLKRKIDVFKNLSLSTVIDILESGKVIEKSKNEIIIRQGDTGDSVYVMINGSASVYINADLNSNQLEELLEPQYVKKTLRSAPFARPSGSLKSQKEYSKVTKNNDRKLLGEFTAKINEGQLFGELALIQKECIRNASIITDENVFVWSINRELFNQSLRFYTESLYQEKVEFVNNNFMFKTWMTRLKYQVAMSLVKKSFCFGEKIIVQGQESGDLIFLKRGEAKLIIDIKQHSHQYKVLISDQLNEISSMDISFKDLPQNNKVEDKIDHIRKVTKNIKTHEYEVAILGDNYIIGDIEFCFGIDDNIFTVVATKTCEVYVLGQANLDRIINMKRNATTFNIIQDLAAMKLNIYYNRCSIISELPLLKYLIDEINRHNESDVSLVIKENVVSKKDSLKPIFPPGPVIDIFGPGSVFFRNRLKRKTMESRLAKLNRRKFGNLNTSKINSKNIDDDYNNNNISQTDQYLQNIRKSIHNLSINKKQFRDWETSSEHLENLESRINKWMSNIPVQNKSFSVLSNNFTILKLPRFKSQIPLRSSRFMNPKEINDNSIEDCKNKGEKSILNTAEKNNNKNNSHKNQESFTRQYSEVDFRRLKKEMHIKEKKLAVFRLTNAI